MPRAVDQRPARAMAPPHGSGCTLSHLGQSDGSGDRPTHWHGVTSPAPAAAAGLLQPGTGRSAVTPIEEGPASVRKGP
jgi:hypothetical protein